MGADWPLVQDALVIAALALGAGGAITALLLRGRRKARDADTPAVAGGPGQLEERVRVLERIATDQSIGLADEIEKLRDNGKAN